MTITRVILSAILGMGLIETTLTAVDTHYVALNGQTPESPYTNGWASAASNIQAAVDVSDIGDTVLVSNGVYQTGATNVSGASNRVYISTAITVRSANNDPTNTIIKGAWDPVTTNGPASVRCAYMSKGWLIGFTLTNGSTSGNGGGISCSGASVSNCVITGNAASGGGGGAYYGTLYNCTLSANSTLGGGGGATLSALYDCMLSGNSSSGGGGGANGCTILSNCTLISNSAIGLGGGVSSCARVYNCTISSNYTRWHGGGAYASTLYYCTLTRNWANGPNNNGCGGGAFGCTLYNCLVAGNEVLGWKNAGGGVLGGAMYNCTVVGNKAPIHGSGVSGQNSSAPICVNSIVYFNNASSGGSNWDTGTPMAIFTNSCTVPTTTVWAAGNIMNDPIFIDSGSGYGTNYVAGNYRLSPVSPCVNTGTNMGWMTNACDLDNRQRVRYGRVDMGCYEFISKGTVFTLR